MNKILALISLSMAILTCLSVSANSDANYHEWQLKKLLRPTPVERLSERKGRIFIYDGLHDKDIETALDTEFGRVENMMFVRSVVTDDSGLPKRDKITGESITEDDGCD